MVTAQPATAQQILRDAETEALLNDMAEPLIRAAGMRPADVRMVLINDRSINAFVAGGQIVYLHSGLITEADNANQVQGVIAHELGHVAGGHVVNTAGQERATTIALVSLLLGALAIAGGAGEAGAGVLAAGQQAAIGSYLAYSRTQEATADAAAVRYLSAAGISGKGFVDFFMKLQNLEMRYNIPQDDEQAYGRTHPLSGDRIRFVRDTLSADAAWETPSNADIEARFTRIRAKLAGFVNEPRVTLQQYPLTDQSVAARYARAYAWQRSAHPDRALAEAAALVAADPTDPYFLELHGQLLLESGRPLDALPPLRRAVADSGGQPLIATLLGHALIATEDPANFREAEQVLRDAVVRDNDNPFAWYQLGVVYAHNGDTARAALASAERYSMIGQMALALQSAERAMGGLPVNGPDWLRAQDISLVARAALDEQRRRNRGGVGRSAAPSTQTHTH
ncbi:MAG: M48 family metalloprotease [Sphingopyxis sp.]|nr:M48 family metalloprotease [Sphingopyxis sp.]